MSFRKLRFLFAVLTLPSGSLMGMADTTEQFVATQARFELGLRGSEQDNEKAADEFRALTEQEPGNALCLTYYGSTLAIKARDALLPWRKVIDTFRCDQHVPIFSGSRWPRAKTSRCCQWMKSTVISPPTSTRWHRAAMTSPCSE